MIIALLSALIPLPSSTRLACLLSRVSAVRRLRCQRNATEIRVFQGHTRRDVNAHIKMEAVDTGVG